MARHVCFLNSRPGSCPHSKWRQSILLSPLLEALRHPIQLLYGSFSLFLEDLSILLHLLIFLMNDSQTYKNSYEVSM